MDQQSTTAIPPNGANMANDLFALTDEQILEIESEGDVNVAPGFSPASSPSTRSSEAQPPNVNVIPSAARDRGNTVAPASTQNLRHDSSSPATPRNDSAEHTANKPANAPHESRDTEHGPRTTSHQSSVTSHETEPPPWLAEQMKDPWSGEEAKEFWNGVQQTRQEAAAYRAAFAAPEDARALKELYPGGVNEARNAAQRASILDDIDRSYFGSPDASPEELAAARVQLAAAMLREDPAAFREMVFAGLRTLEEAEKGSASGASTSDFPRLAQMFAANPNELNVASPFRAASSPAQPRATASSVIPSEARDRGNTNDLASAHSLRQDSSSPSAPRNDSIEQPATTTEHGSRNTGHETLAAYAAFEKATNEDLERSVGAAISRTIEQALPNLQRSSGQGDAGARHGVSLRERLGLAVRQDVEAALKGDRQLGEQIAQILSARRFDNETRAQVVRLIDDRARQLVPSAAKRLINDWTQTTLAAHRDSAARANAASVRREVEPANSESGKSSMSGTSSRAALARPAGNPNRSAMRSDSHRLDYRKLSDEQILDL